MNRLVCCLVALIALSSPAYAGNLVNFTIGGNIDTPVVPTELGHLHYDGQGGNLTSDNLLVTSLTYETSDPLPAAYFPYPWRAMNFPSGKLSFSTGNLLRVDGDSLVFAPGGSISIVGDIAAPGQHVAFMQEVYHGAFTQEVQVINTGGTLKVVAGGYDGHFDDVFSAVYGLSETQTYNGNLALTFSTTAILDQGFDNPVSGGNATIDITTIPEPTSLAMFGLGITGLMFCQRLRRRRR